MHKTAVGLLIGLSIAAFGQHPPVKTNANAAPKPISHYMREVGLLYLEDVESMLEQSRKDMLPSGDSMSDNSCCSTFYWMGQSYAKSLEGLENRIDINISSSAGDRAYFELLKRTKSAAQQSAATSKLVGRKKTVEEAVEFGKELDMYPECEAQAVSVAKSGMFTIGACTEKRLVLTERVILDEELKAATADLAKSREHLARTLCGKSAIYETCADAHLVEEAHHKSAPLKPSKPLSEELRAKCATFADGSVDRVLAGTMPLPPKECTEGLSWMRDSRLSALYDAQPSQK